MLQRFDSSDVLKNGVVHAGATGQAERRQAERDELRKVRESIGVRQVRRYRSTHIAAPNGHSN